MLYDLWFHTRIFAHVFPIGYINLCKTCYPQGGLSFNNLKKLRCTRGSMLYTKYQDSKPNAFRQKYIFKFSSRKSIKPVLLRNATNYSHQNKYLIQYRE